MPSAVRSNVCVTCGNNKEHSARFARCARCLGLPSSSIFLQDDPPIYGGPPYFMTGTGRMFGVEIECLVPEGLDDDGVTEALGAGWVATEDGSLRVPQYGRDYPTRPQKKGPIKWENEDALAKRVMPHHEAVEYRSPVFYGDRGLAMLYRAASQLRRLGAYTNSSCGLHVHMDTSDLTQDDIEDTVDFFRHYQSQFFAMVHKQRAGTTYCRALPTTGLPNDHYYWLSTSALERHGTIEFRLHHGTTDPLRISMWVRLLLDAMEAAKRFGGREKKPSDVFDTLTLTPRVKTYWDNLRKKYKEDYFRLLGSGSIPFLEGKKNIRAKEVIS